MQMYAPNPDWSKVPPARKPRAKRNAQPEQELQIACVKLLRSLPNTIVFSIPNHLFLGGKMTGAKLGYITRQKAMGLTPGCWDLVVIFRNNEGNTRLFGFELKAASNKQSDNQEIFAFQAKKAGVDTVVVRSLDDLTSLLRDTGHCSFR